MGLGVIIGFDELFMWYFQVIQMDVIATLQQQTLTIGITSLEKEAVTVFVLLALNVIADVLQVWFGRARKMVAFLHLK